MLSQFAAYLVPLGIVAFICGLTVLSLPWRRRRSITRRTAIAAPPTRVWKIFQYDPADPLSALLHENSVSVERIDGTPKIVEMTLDTSGGHGTSLITVREEIIEERPPEYSASRIIEVNDNPYPFGRDNLCIVELSATRDGTLAASRWRGETVCLWQ